ncbi:MULTISPECIES: plasmid partition protein ParG [Bacillaceae]|uniref:Uncharacterized protein n=1 Tax=Evansella alkalicola TaxID=745819 RepID=A0ABS6K0D4_9BACI|nr:plasmid partition protein ParG [Litchfieldia alkalitelluris]MBU9724105.1 hypothetical protein [Bacillus alkalicola]
MVRKAVTTSIDEELQKKFKQKCSEQGLKQNDVLEALIRTYLEEEFEVEKEVIFRLKKK